MEIGWCKSDHSHLLMKVKAPSVGGRMPFRFCNCLAKHKLFLSIVRTSWAEFHSRNPIENIIRKLNMIKNELKKLHLKEFTNIHKKIQAWELSLH